MQTPAIAKAGAVTVGDETFEITTTTKDGCISYIDPVLAKTAADLIELRDIERECKREIRRLEAIQTKRLKALNMLGALHVYPTQQQRKAIATLEMAVAMKQPEMIKVCYDLCIETGAHKSNWRSEHGEPLASYVAREMVDVQKATRAAYLAAVGVVEE